MKKLFAAFFAAISGYYLIALAWIPDPLPFLDEALALAIFLKSMNVLGVPIPRWLPLGRSKPTVANGKQGPVVDI